MNLADIMCDLIIATYKLELCKDRCIKESLKNESCNVKIEEGKADD